MLVKLVVRAPRKLAELMSQVLFEAGAGGIEELDGGRRLVVYAESRDNAEGIALRARELIRQAAPDQRGIALAIEVDENSDWASSWTQHLRQVALTPTLVIQPVWDETPAPSGAQRVVFDPKLSFGRRSACDDALGFGRTRAGVSRTRRGSLLDFGSGTGVLSFVALLSGADSAWGVDIDPVSVAAAQHNAELNGLSARAQFSLPDALDALDFTLVVANLEAPDLFSSAAELLRRARAAERLIVTGFLADRQSEVAKRFAPAFAVAHADYELDWALLELIRAR